MPLIERARPAWWKWIGNAREEDLICAAILDGLGVRLVVRHAGMDGRDWREATAENPEGTAAEFVAQCREQPWFPMAWAVETPNEPAPVWECTPQYVRFMGECVRLFEQDGKECIAGNFGTAQGAPPAVLGARHYGVHWYFGDGMLWPDPLEALAQELPQDARIWVTEAGFTAALGTDVPPGQDTGYGWRGRISPAHYADMLIRRDQDAQRILGGRYAGLAVFQAGADADWAATFETAGGDVERLLWPEDAAPGR